MNPTLQGILIVVMLVVLFGTPLYALFDRKRKQTILLAWLGCILAGGFAVMLFEKVPKCLYPCVEWVRGIECAIVAFCLQ